jgi:hypothetical protein
MRTGYEKCVDTARSCGLGRAASQKRSPPFEKGITFVAPVLHIGRAADNRPHVEVIADLADLTISVVFHAMMLRPGLVAALQLDQYFTPQYAPQRP